MSSAKKSNEKLTKLRQLKTYIVASRSHYQGLRKKEKTHFINGLLKVFEGTDMHRKSVLRSLARCPQVKQSDKTANPAYKPLGRPALYEDDNLHHWLCELWLALGQVHEGLMKAMLPNWLEHLPLTTGPDFATKQKLLNMSVSTMQRKLSSFKGAHHKKHLSATRKGPFKGLETLIPQRPLNFKVNCCGYLEGDTVAHCGHSLSGTHAWTLNVVDHHSHWTEQEAILGKTADNVLKATINIRSRLAFAIKGFHNDCGSEFINHELYEYFKDPKHFVLQTSGRPYKKNDQAHIEQRNWTHVRQVFGYERIDTSELLHCMNDIYSNELRLLNNFFTATQKLKTKTRKGSKYHRKFFEPQTPFQRVLEDKAVSEIEKQKLKKQFQALNPFELRKSLNKKLLLFKNLLNKLNGLSDGPLQRKVA